MSTVHIKIDRVDGTPEILELDLSLDTMTMRESVRLEAAIGPELFERLVSGSLEGPAAISPRIVQAVIYAKLKTIRPEVELDAFDLDLEELEHALEAVAANPKAATSRKGSSA